MKSLRISNLSLEEMSQCLCSLISVKSHGLMSAPLQPKKMRFVIPMTDASEDANKFKRLSSTYLPVNDALIFFFSISIGSCC